MVYLNHQKNRGTDHPVEGGSRKEDRKEVEEYGKEIRRTGKTG